jgi:Holliday junction resolvase RusA-like endonuclease
MIEFYLPIRVLPKHDGGEFKRCKSAAARKRRQACIDNTNAIRLAASPWAPRNPLEGPVRVDTWFIRRMNKKMFALGLGEQYGDVLPCDVAPDAGNMRKQLLDALEDMFYLNDAQVSGFEMKTWGEEFGVRIRIEPFVPSDVRRLWNATGGTGG